MAREVYVKYSRSLKFRQIKPAADAGLLIRWGRDLYRESLGREDAFYRDYGRYGASFPVWIASCLAGNPDFAAMLTEDSRPIGMAVLGHDQNNPALGRVHHFYVEESHRGKGFGGLLDDYARDALTGVGAVRARLNVACANERARRFYKAQGWEETDRRGGLVWMETAL